MTTHTLPHLNQNKNTQAIIRLGLKGVFKVPFFIQRIMLEKTLLHVFREALQEGELNFLIGHYLKIHIIDMNCTWYFTNINKTIVVRKNAPATITISGQLSSFAQLIARCTDPDTLFFQRKLMIEGDTEMGLQIKNLLDDIDPETLPIPFSKAIDMTSKYIC